VRLCLRLGAVLSLAAVVGIYALYISIETNTFNAYCMEERGGVIRSGLADLKFWEMATGWWVVTVLPCLGAQQLGSLKTLAAIAIGFAVICASALPLSFNQPIECYTSGGSYPSDAFDVLVPLSAVLVSVVFYALLFLDVLRQLA